MSQNCSSLQRGFFELSIWGRVELEVAKYSAVLSMLLFVWFSFGVFIWGELAAGCKPKKVDTSLGGRGN